MDIKINLFNNMFEVRKRNDNADKHSEVSVNVRYIVLSEPN
jgi:hypothetical protein